MEKLPGNKRGGVGKGEGRAGTWMEKLPGRRLTRVGEQVRRMDSWGERRKGEQRSGSGVGNGSGYGSVRGRIVVG